MLTYLKIIYNPFIIKVEKMLMNKQIYSQKNNEFLTFLNYNRVILLLEVCINLNFNQFKNSKYFDHERSVHKHRIISLIKPKVFVVSLFQFVFAQRKGKCYRPVDNTCWLINAESNPSFINFFHFNGIPKLSTFICDFSR